MILLRCLQPSLEYYYSSQPTCYYWGQSAGQTPGFWRNTPAAPLQQHVQAGQQQRSHVSAGVIQRYMNTMTTQLMSRAQADMAPNDAFSFLFVVLQDDAAG
jgi:hypothetical protein